MYIHIPSPDKPQSIPALREDLAALDQAVMSGYGNETHLISVAVPERGGLLAVNVVRPSDGQSSFTCTFQHGGTCIIASAEAYAVGGRRYISFSMNPNTWADGVQQIIDVAKRTAADTVQMPEAVRALIESVECV
jgi:precorrin-6B methylase 2